MTSTTKRLIYKVARFNKETPGVTLQDLLFKALQKKKAALSRRQKGDGDGQYSLINYHGPHKGMRCGEYFDYTQGQHQPVAEFDDTADTLKLTSIPPKDKTNFLHSILYFGILGDHVILAQSQSLRSPQFESYLNWLLSETGHLGEGNFVSLVDCIPEEKKRAIKSTKGISIHAPVRFDPVGGRIATKGEQTKSISYTPKDVGWDWLNKILPDELQLPKEIKGKDLVEDGALRVTLYMHWKRLGQDDSTALLDQISNQLRHTDTELDYEIHTKSGIITKEEIKLAKPVSVPLTKEGLVVKLELWERMRLWLQLLNTEGRVPPLA